MFENSESIKRESRLPVFIFAFLILFLASVIFMSVLPFFEEFFKSSLHAKVHNNSTELVKPLEKRDIASQPPSYIFSWYIDVNLDTENSVRYIFNPFLTVVLPSLIAGIMFAVFFSSLLPPGMGYMRAKISREIEVQLSKISNFRNMGESDQAIKEELRKLDIDKLKKSSDDWGVTIEDLSVIKSAITWESQSNFFKRLLSINDGLSMYMRFHFTYKYSNIVLGFVYIGAAILIIIVGLRGLKFIPLTQPSLVLFALSLEFSLLVTYAFTIMYGRQEEEQERLTPHEVSLSMTGADFGSSKEIERFLITFIHNTEDKDKK